jgi:uncharacterized protein (DUF302 family)
MTGEKKKMELGITVQMQASYEDALENVIAALTTEGFGVLTEIDVKDTLKKKLGVDFRKYKILGACNPPLAYQALQIASQVGLLLPCNVTVAETEAGGVEVSLVDPLSMLGVIDDPRLQPVAEEARLRLGRVAAALKGAAV